jgi:hypothetical protein
VKNKKDAADEIRRKKAEADNKRNLGATKKLELKKKAAADKKAEEKEKKIIAEIQKSWMRTLLLYRRSLPYQR